MHPLDEAVYSGRGNIININVSLISLIMNFSSLMQTAKKNVLFADGVSPGMGTSSSDTTDEMIPLPFRSRASRNKRNKRKIEQDEKRTKFDSRNDRTATSKSLKVSVNVLFNVCQLHMFPRYVRTFEARTGS